MVIISLLIISLIILPLVLLALVMFFGVLIGAIFSALFTTIVYVLLRKMKFFEQYRRSDKTWQRVLSMLLHVAMVITMVISWILVAGMGYILYQC